MFFNGRFGGQKQVPLPAPGSGPPTVAQGSQPPVVQQQRLQGGGVRQPAAELWSGGAVREPGRRLRGREEEEEEEEEE